MRDAWAPPSYNADRAFTVYAASKTEAERALWKSVEERKPHFVVNCVNPNANLGRILASPGATGNWVPSVLKWDISIDTPPRTPISPGNIIVKGEADAYQSI